MPVGVRCARIAVPPAWGRSTALLCSALCWHSSVVSGMRSTGAIGITAGLLFADLLARVLASPYVSIRQHASEDSIRQHTSEYRLRALRLRLWCASNQMGD